MLQAVNGFVTLANLALALVIGLRLLRRGLAHPRGPERWLGGFFLLNAFVASTLSLSLYLGWADPSLVLPDPVARGLNAGHFATSTLGNLALLAFIRVTFRPDSSRALLVAWLLGCALVCSATGVGITEGFQVRVLNGSAYWAAWIVRWLIILWVTAESIHYWLLMRKRLRLGLVEPVVANRFFLWSVWGSAVLVMSFTDPLARFAYVQATGSTEVWVAEVGFPIVLKFIAMSSTLGLTSAVALLLAFFPSGSYRRWIDRRATPAIR